MTRIRVCFYLAPPAAVHPKTGRVCVPIDPANVREFDPFLVPTLGQLLREVDQYDKEHGEEVSDVVRPRQGPRSNVFAL